MNSKNFDCGVVSPAPGAPLKSPSHHCSAKASPPTPTESVVSKQAQLLTGSSAFLHTTLGKMPEAIETQCP